MPQEELERLIQTLEEEMHQAARISDSSTRPGCATRSWTCGRSPRRSRAAGVGAVERVPVDPGVGLRRWAPGAPSRTPGSSASEGSRSPPRARGDDRGHRRRARVDGFLMPAVADRHVHIGSDRRRPSLGGRDRRPRPRLAARSDLRPGGCVRAPDLRRSVDPGGGADADRPRRLSDAGRMGPPGTGREVTGPGGRRGRGGGSGRRRRRSRSP